MKLNHLDLFSGIGGFSLGLEATGGFETKAFCDIEEYPRQVLQKHWPYVKQYKDIKELNYDRLKSDGLVPIDIITGGYPCQPFSVAGKQKGVEDPRHLWPEYFRLVKECRPTWVIGENVSGHIKLGLDSVIEDLESENYSVRPFSISASSVGANHQRERIWIVAYSERNDNFNEEQRVNGEEKEISREHRKNDSTTREFSGTNTIRKTNDGNVENAGRTQWPRAELREENENETREGNANQYQRSSEASEFDVANTKSKRTRKNDEGLRTRSGRASGRETTDVANTDSEGLQRQWESCNQFGSQFTTTEGSEEGQRTMGQGWWESEPNVGRVAHGIPKRVDRLKSLGNSLIPQIPYYIGKTILEVMNGKIN
jgi:DNA (cytosine-5)-methyltransferase 1